MGLSDEERKRLEELERGLADEDPALAYWLAGGAGPSGGRALMAGLAAGLGLVLLVAGVALQVALIGVAGFGLLTVGVIRLFLLPVPPGHGT